MKAKIVCLIIALLWIGLGTIVQLANYYNFLEFNFNCSIYSILWWITFPSNILLFVLLYVDKISNTYFLIIFLQFVKVLMYWWLFYKIWMFVKKTKNNRSSKVSSPPRTSCGWLSNIVFLHITKRQSNPIKQI